MVVAALCLAASPASALADANGVVAVRRVADTAAAAGARPIIAISFDPEGAVAAALEGSPAVLGEPAPVELGPVGQIARAFDLALEREPDLTGALVWPARITWVRDATVARLIAEHVANPSATLALTFEGERGWPILLRTIDLERFRTLPPSAMPGDLFVELVGAGVPERLIEVTDPGVVHDVSTPRQQPPG